MNLPHALAATWGTATDSSRDVDEDEFLALAMTAQAHAVISGDRDLLDVVSHEDDPFQMEIAFLGIESSPSFVAPEGNGCAARIVRTLKERRLWVCTVATVEALRLALAEWAEPYNREWMIGSCGASV